MGSFVDPQDGERKRLIRQILAAGDAISTTAQAMAKMRVQPPDDMITRERLELLIDTLFPQHAGDVNQNPKDITDNPSTASMPSNIERLELELEWHRRLRAMTDAMMEELKKSPEFGGLSIINCGNGKLHL